MKKEMTKDPEIEARKADIAVTRERLASGVDELKGRVSPGKVAQAAIGKANDMVHETKQAVTEGVKNAATETTEIAKGGASSFGRAIRDNPIPSTLTALGIGYLIYEAARGSRQGSGSRDTFSGYDEPGHHEGAYAQRGSARVGADGDKLRVGHDDDEAGERIRDLGHRAKEGATELAERAREGGEYVAQQARQGGRMARRKTRAAFTDQPMVFGLGAFVAGLAIGAMVPGTEREDELLGEQRDRFVREARSRAQDAGEVAKDAARKAVDHVDRELPPGGDRDHASGEQRASTAEKPSGSAPIPGSPIG